MMRTQGVMLRVREGGSLMTENYSFHLEVMSAGLETYILIHLSAGVQNILSCFYLHLIVLLTSFTYIVDCPLLSRSYKRFSLIQKQRKDIVL